jgi:hypothetical protein
MSGKYLVAIKGFKRTVPAGLQKFVKDTILEKFKLLDIEFDFDGKTRPRDLTVVFSAESPFNPIFGESSRPDFDGDEDPGEATIFVGTMKAYRLEVSASTCESAFPEKNEFLGSLIANTAIHEIAHMLGLNTGGHDMGGHEDNPDNMMHSPKADSARPVKLFSNLVYTVQKNDSLSSIIDRFKSGELDKCHKGSSNLTRQHVIGSPDNATSGFFMDPAVTQDKKEKLGSPFALRVGEKIALPTHFLRSAGYRTRNFPWLLGDKSFAKQQQEKMKAFIEKRVKAGLG